MKLKKPDKTMQLIDSHCHLYFEALATDLDEVMERAAKSGITKMINVGTSVADSQKALDIAARYDNVWASVGAHPHDAAEFLDELDSVEKLLKLAQANKVVAIGEIGLDYFKNYVPREVQVKALQAQLEATHRLGLPYIFHVREAWQDFWPIFDKFPNFSGVVHSFSDTPKHLQEVLDRGLLVGLNGIMTFSKVDAQLEAARSVPLDKLILETDAPFLAPKPFRGQTCEPMHVRTTAEFLAKLRNDPLEELAEITTQNSLKLFDLQ